MQRAQSSIEYISTYGWALVVIVVVLVALYSLGVFDLGNIAAKAQPGACQVYRPYGPGTTQLLSMQGVCTGIPPKFIASFNGASGKVTIANSPYTGPPGQLTITAWMYAASTTPSTQYAVSKISGTTGYAFPITTNGWSTLSFNFYTTTGSLDTVSASYPTPTIWHFVAATYNGVAMSIYIDGSLAATSAQTGNIAQNSQNLTIGTGSGGWFNGYVSNLQVYNASLNANQIRTLYSSGIGEQPQVLQNLTGWWPLNGDFNDYSGNGGNGASNSISFISSWTRNYNH